MLTISGEKLLADIEVAAKLKKNFKILLMKNIYLMNKFISWMKLVCTLDCFQKKTLASTKEASAPGYKRSKDIMTLSICNIAAGFHKLPSMIIGKSGHRSRRGY